MYNLCEDDSDTSRESSYLANYSPLLASVHCRLFFVAKARICGCAVTAVHRDHLVLISNAGLSQLGITPSFSANRAASVQLWSELHV